MIALHVSLGGRTLLDLVLFADPAPDEDEEPAPLAFGFVPCEVERAEPYPDPVFPEIPYDDE